MTQQEHSDAQEFHNDKHTERIDNKHKIIQGNLDTKFDFYNHKKSADYHMGKESQM